jgi:hypothetical protein
VDTLLSLVTNRTRQSRRHVALFNMTTRSRGFQQLPPLGREEEEAGKPAAPGYAAWDAQVSRTSSLTSKKRISSLTSKKGNVE